MSKVRIYNKELCPHLWQNMQLDSEVRKSLLQAAKDFYEKTEFKAPIRDIYLMGSAANYNWTPESDVDVHILIDFKQLQMPEDTACAAVKNASSRWNTEHDIRVKGHKVEMNLQDASEQKPHVMGIYSLVKDGWIRKPSREIPNVNKVQIVSRYTKFKNYIEKAIASKDRKYMKSVKEYLDQVRQYGLDTKGELSVENLVFKILRSRGILKKLKDAITATYDAELSVAEGYGAGIPEKDRLHIAGKRWQIRSKDAPKTPKMKEEEINVEQINEVTQKQIGASAPSPSAIFRGEIRLDRMTLANLNHLKQKMARFIKAHRHDEDRTILNQFIASYKLYDEEIKRRLAYINEPIAEAKEELTLVPGGNDLAPGAFKIMLNGEWFANTYKTTEDWGKYANQWIFNRAAGALKRNFPTIDQGFNSPEEVVNAVKEKLKKLKSNEGFDPTSAGPNPEATEGQPQDPNFYQNHVERMRRMEEQITLREFWGYSKEDKK